MHEQPIECIAHTVPAASPPPTLPPSLPHLPPPPPPRASRQSSARRATRRPCSRTCASASRCARAPRRASLECARRPESQRAECGSRLSRLSGPRSTPVVAVVVVFQAIKSLDMREAGKEGRRVHEAIGLKSPEGEYVRLEDSHKVTCAGAVEAWLLAVETGMCATLAKDMYRVRCRRRATPGPHATRGRRCSAVRASGRNQGVQRGVADACALGGAKGACRGFVLCMLVVARANALRSLRAQCTPRKPPSSVRVVVD